MDGSGTTKQSNHWSGQAMPRREDPALLRGAGRFVDDITPEGCLFLDVLRSTVAAGRILSVDTSAALECGGVLAAFAADDLHLAGQAAVNMLIPGAPALPLSPLAKGQVRAVGQPIAAVIATSRNAARDGAEAIWAEIDDTDPTDTQPQPIATWQGGQGTSTGTTVSATLTHARVAPMALEPRACLAEPVGDTGLRVFLSTQTPFRARDDLARILGLAPDQVQMIAPDVGGAFGGKASITPEDVLTAYAAHTLRRPVKWVATRSDEFQSATQGRGAVTTAHLTVTPEGQLAALSADLLFPLGSWTPYSAYAPARNAGRILPGPYDVAAVEVALSVQPGAGAAMNIYRGAGRPEAAMLLERLIDKAAHATGRDPLQMRRAVIRDGRTPGPSITGTWIDTGDYAALLDRLDQISGYAELRADQTRRRAGGEVVGIGLSLYIEPCGQGWETARIALLPDGRFRADTGSSAQGQGRQTAWAQIAADALGVSPARVQVAEGDTSDLPNGIGALASRSTAIGGSALMRAAQTLRAQILAAFGRVIGTDTLRVTDAGISTPTRHLDWTEVAAMLPPEAVCAEDTHTAAHEAWASGAALVQVAIDRDTGRATVEQVIWVDDAGHVINPLLVEGQLWGGMAQGIACVLSERVVYDDDGQLLTGSLMDYAVPRAKDMPRAVTLDKRLTPSAANPLGVKGVGEAGCIAIPPALYNALHDALRLTDTDLPIPATAETLWRALQTPKETP